MQAIEVRQQFGRATVQSLVLRGARSARLGGRAVRPWYKGFFAAGPDAVFDAPDYATPSGGFPLIVGDGRGFSLHVSPSLGGSVRLGDRETTVSALFDDPAATPGEAPGWKLWRIPETASGHVDLGWSTFAFLPAAPLCKASGQ